jgi:hypothetical protein
LALINPDQRGYSLRQQTSNKPHEQNQHVSQRFDFTCMHGSSDKPTVAARKHMNKARFWHSTIYAQYAQRFVDKYFMK